MTTVIKFAADDAPHLRSVDFVISSFLPLIVMPLDCEEHARAKHENLECEEDYRKPIHHFEYSEQLLDYI